MWHPISTSKFFPHAVPRSSCPLPPPLITYPPAMQSGSIVHPGRDWAKGRGPDRPRIDSRKFQGTKYNSMMRMEEWPMGMSYWPQKWYRHLTLWGKSLVIKGPKWGHSSTGHSLVTPTCLGVRVVLASLMCFLLTQLHVICYTVLFCFLSLHPQDRPGSLLLLLAPVVWWTEGLMHWLAYHCSPQQSAMWPGIMGISQLDLGRWSFPNSSWLIHPLLCHLPYFPIWFLPRGSPPQNFPTQVLWLRKYSMCAAIRVKE